MSRCEHCSRKKTASEAFVATMIYFVPWIVFFAAISGYNACRERACEAAGGVRLSGECVEIKRVRP